MKKAILTAAVIFLTSGLFAEAGFSGYSGGKINYATNEAQTQEYDPDLTLQALEKGLQCKVGIIFFCLRFICSVIYFTAGISAEGCLGKKPCGKKKCCGC